ncbi:MAG TPA: tripartite tricarboxylate transporter substrate binding protein [Burkholderiales bacterium]|nr:tripartite tricarboxylate transporter substrate binding protein [Burkholderiales bacterium]
MNIPFRVPAAVLCCLLLAGTALAQQWPSKPIRFITVGAADALPRLLAQDISGPLGQQIIIDEHAGASGTIGAEYAARQPPDGYTFLVATSTHVVVPNFYKLNYDFMRDFVPVAMLGNSPFMLIAHPSLPAKDLAEVVALAKSKPGQLSFSATSAGSSSHLVAEMFITSAHLDIIHVPYKSMAAALTDLLGGQVQLASSVGATAVAQIKANKVRALAVSTPKRSLVVPDVPTFAELGYSKVIGTAWYAVVAPTGTPAPIISRMSTELLKALNKPGMSDKLITSFAVEPDPMTPDEMRAFLQQDAVRWAEAAKAANVKIKGGLQ